MLQLFRKAEKEYLSRATSLINVIRETLIVNQIEHAIIMVIFNLNSKFYGCFTKGSNREVFRATKDVAAELELFKNIIRTGRYLQFMMMVLQYFLFLLLAFLRIRAVSCSASSTEYLSTSNHKQKLNLEP